jgi:purine-binding chemotaxis protein CheW
MSALPPAIIEERRGHSQNRAPIDLPDPAEPTSHLETRPPTTPLPGLSRPQLAGKYLTFVVGDHPYGLPIGKVREIVRQASITPFPSLPSYIPGVINLRGKIVPVLDLRKKFGLRHVPAGSRMCLIVTYVVIAGTTKLLGLAVDAIEEVKDSLSTDKLAAPAYALSRATGYFHRLTAPTRAMKALDVDLLAREERHILPFAASSTELPPAWV